MKVQNIHESVPTVAELLLGQEFVSTAQFNYALDIKQSELDSITARDRRQGRRERMIWEIFLDLAWVNLEEVQYCQRLQRGIRKGLSAAV